MPEQTSHRHLAELLRKGEGTEFNKWRRTYPQQKIVFCGENFAGLQLVGVNFSDMRFVDCDFTGSTVTRGSMENVHAIRCLFEGLVAGDPEDESIRMNWEFFGAVNCTFDDAKLAFGRFGGARIVCSRFSGDVFGATMADIELLDCDLGGIRNLNTCTFTRPQLYGLVGLTPRDKKFLAGILVRGLTGTASSAQVGEEDESEAEPQMPSMEVLVEAGFAHFTHKSPLPQASEPPASAKVISIDARRPPAIPDAPATDSPVAETTGSPASLPDISDDDIAEVFGGGDE